MPGYLKQPCNTPGCGPCGSGSGGGGEPSLGTATCESRSGSGSLRGWSKFQNHNSGDWNGRKSTQAEYALSPNPYQPFELFSSVDCSGAVFGLGGGDLEQLTTTPVTWDVSSNTQVGVGDFQDRACSFTQSSDVSPPNLPGSGLTSSSTSDSVLDDYSKRRTYTDPGSPTCGSAGGACSPAVTKQRYGATATCDLLLSVPDTVDAALARGTSSTGSLCRTTAGTIGSTTAGSNAGISVSGTTSVKVTIEVLGLTGNTAYSFDIIVNRYTAGGGAFVDDMVVSVSFVTGPAETMVNYEYHVPVNTDFDYEYDHAENLTSP